MDQHLKKVYVPMTETAFFILFCLRKPNHGYGIVQTVEKMTEGAIKLTPGTMYGSLSKMEKDKVIRFVREEKFLEGRSWNHVFQIKAGIHKDSNVWEVTCHLVTMGKSPDKNVYLDYTSLGFVDYID